MYKMGFVLLNQIRGRDPRAAAPYEIHLCVNRTESQPRLEDQQNAAIKQKARSQEANYHRNIVVSGTAGNDCHQADCHTGRDKHSGSEVKAHHRTLQYARAAGQLIELRKEDALSFFSFISVFPRQFFQFVGERAHAIDYSSEPR